MSKEIDDSFDKVEKVVERSGKLLIKIFTVIVAVILGITIAISQLDFEFFPPKDDSLKHDTIVEKDTIIIEKVIIDSIYIKPIPNNPDTLISDTLK